MLDEVAFEPPVVAVVRWRVDDGETLEDVGFWLVVVRFDVCAGGRCVEPDPLLEVAPFACETPTAGPGA